MPNYSDPFYFQKVHHKRYGPSPLQHGLMTGAIAALNGFVQDRQQQHAMEAKMMMAKMKVDNDRAMKMMQLEANQRTYSIRQTDADGVTRTHTFKNVLNPDTGHWEPQEIGKGARDKSKGYDIRNTTDAKGNPMVLAVNKDDPTDMRVVSRGTQAPSARASDGYTYDARTGKPLAQLGDGTGGKNGRVYGVPAGEIAKNARDALTSAREAVKDYNGLGSEDEKRATMQVAGLNYDSYKTDAERAAALKNAVYSKEEARLNDGSKARVDAQEKERLQRQQGDSNKAKAAASQVPTTSDGKTLYIKDGQAYVKDGKGGMVPAVKNPDGTFSSPQVAADTSSLPTHQDYTDSSSVPQGQLQPQPVDPQASLMGEPDAQPDEEVAQNDQNEENQPDASRPNDDQETQGASDNEEDEPQPDDEEQEQPQGLMSRGYA